MWVIPSTTLLILLYACQPAICCFKPDPQSCKWKCGSGIANRNRIVGGQEALKDEFPWQVGLVPSNSKQPFCGGTLISPRDVLTAAHCLIGKSTSNIRVKKIVHGEFLTWDIFLDACKIVSHNKFDSAKQDDYDYAIIHLCTPSDHTFTFLPVCLPTVDLGSLYENRGAIATGWGSASFSGGPSATLQKVSLTTLSNAACCRHPYGWRCDELSPRTICAMGNGKGTCLGDSGGPLIVKESNGYYTLVGVSSFVARGKCGEFAFPSVFARVTDQLSWIKDNMVEGQCHEHDHPEDNDDLKRK